MKGVEGVGQTKLKRSASEAGRSGAFPFNFHCQIEIGFGLFHMNYRKEEPTTTGATRIPHFVSRLRPYRVDLRKKVF